MLRFCFRYNQVMNNFILFIPGLIGLLSGVLINYIADVLPATRRLSRPACWNCNTPRTWLDFLLLRKCQHCSSRSKPRSWIILILLVAASILVWVFPRVLPYSLSLLIILYFFVVVIIDLEHRAVMYPTSVAGAVIALGTGIYLRGNASIIKGISTSLIGGVAGFLIMWIFYLLGMAYVRRMAKKKGLPPDEVAFGFGDVTLSGILGLLLGWPTIIGGLLYGVLAGGVVSLIIIVVMLVNKKYQAFTAIPYAPFLILAAAYLLFF